MSPKTQTHFTLENILEKTPDIKSPSPLGFEDKGRGASIFLNKIPSFKFISIIEFLPEKGLRGNHFHSQKHEYFYVQSGEMVGYFWDPTNPDDRRKEILKAGDFFDIKPGLAHGFEALQKTTAIELSPTAFQCDDNTFVENPFLTTA